MARAGYGFIRILIAACALSVIFHLVLYWPGDGRVGHDLQARAVAEWAIERHRQLRNNDVMQPMPDVVAAFDDVKNHARAKEEMENFMSWDDESEAQEVFKVKENAAHQAKVHIAQMVIPPRLRTAVGKSNDLLQVLPANNAPQAPDNRQALQSRERILAAAFGNSNRIPGPAASKQEHGDRLATDLEFPCNGYWRAQWVKKCPQTCNSEPTRITGTVHFILLDNKFGFMFWLAVRSAVVYARAQAINIFSAVERSEFADNCWMQRVLNISTVHFYHIPAQRFPTQINGHKIVFIQHYSDWLRLAILWSYGGVYMDTDSIIAKPLQPLMASNHAVLSRQATRRPGNGMFVVRERSCFVCHYARQACKNFRGNWSDHSSMTLEKMFGGKQKASVSIPSLKNVVLLEHMKGFFPFSWTRTGLYNLFDKPITQKERQLIDVYALHLYNYVSKQFQPHLLNFTWIHEQKSMLSKTIATILPRGFARRSMDTKQCLRWAGIPG
ncbi:uncharacterized protein LOC135811711 [Sycon ciliatum]|uniref:uncharacterized protein LOC135811711 n=1 Tax=Sycon ciliatum TaxID=27933 RepID=UPI0031F650A2